MAQKKKESMFDCHLEDVVQGVKEGYSAKAMFDKFFGEDNGYNYNSFRIWAWNRNIRYYAERKPKCIRCKNCGSIRHKGEDIKYCRIAEKEVPKNLNPSWCPMDDKDGNV